MDSSAGGGKDEDAGFRDGEAPVVGGDGFGGPADPGGDGIFREVEGALAEIELDCGEGDGEGLGGGYGFAPGWLRPVEEMGNRCGRGEVEACAEESSAVG